MEEQVNINYMEKICTKCNINKNISLFSKEKAGKYGVGSICKNCKSLYYKKYYQLNDNKFKESRKNKKEYFNNYIKNRKKVDPNFKLICYLRTSLYKSLHKHKIYKNNSITKLTNCSNNQLKHHLESQFKPEMNWNNYGKVWEIDHIIPISSFNLIESSEQEKCFNYTNLQPLFKTTEIAKSFGYTDQIGNRNKSAKF